jgi:DNA polymerase-3 subunit gamma/tau
MDAASNTGVDDVREIIEAVRYAAVSARYKIYIVDEVHMLSKPAFNALLKTLEEPPPHVKFIFATTEVNKVPVTILSRCQRFDLRRITPDMLFANFRMICDKEQVEADDAALWMIAKAAEGSARDGQSILDQAIAHADLDGAGRVTVDQVQTMLGLSDGGATRRLFARLLAGESGAAIDDVRAQFALGVEPIAIVRGLMTLTHGVALMRAARTADAGISVEDSAAIGEWAQALSMAQAQRLWQLLLRAHDEVVGASHPLEALEMAVLRIVHAGTMPDPDSLAALLRDAGQAGTGNMPTMGAAPAPEAARPRAPSHSPAPIAATATGPEASIEPSALPIVTKESPPTDIPTRSDALPEDLQGLADVLSDSGERMLGSLLRREGRLVQLVAGSLVLSRDGLISEDDCGAIARALHAITDQPWVVALSDAAGQPTLAEKAAHEQAARLDAIARDPLVSAITQHFPNAQILPPSGARGDEGSMIQ